MTTVPPPLALLAELTHRCPLQCPYCSNPLELLKASHERDTAFWLGVIDEAAALGVLQIHFSGGEPTLRQDLAQLIAHATLRGMYANLITSAVLLDQAKLDGLAAAGLGHVQISLQGAEAETADRIGHYKNGHEKKLQIARMVPGAGMSLTINAATPWCRAESGCASCALTVATLKGMKRRQIREAFSASARADRVIGCSRECFPSQAHNQNIGRDAYGRL